MLQGRDIEVARGGRTVLSGVSVGVRPGQVVGVLGANGAGKSTLLAALAGELPILAGQIALNGRPLPSLAPARLARERAVLPQKPSLGFDMEVDEVVAMGVYPFPELAPAAVRAVCDRALAHAQAAPLAGRRYLELSGGEQQRVQFARVLAQCLAGRSQGAARLLLLDEPSASLDPRHQHGLFAAVHHLARQAALGALVVLHDVNLAARWCDRLLLLGGGTLLACGEPQAVLTARNLELAYDIPVTLVPNPHASGRPLVMFGQEPL